MTAPLDTLLQRAGFVRKQDAPGPFGPATILCVRNFGSLHAMVMLSPQLDQATAMLGMGAPGQNIRWRPWSLRPDRPGAGAVVAQVLAFAEVLNSMWPHGVGASRNAYRATPGRP